METGNYEYDASGVDRKHRYAIEGTKWKEWLGMEIDATTLQTFSESEIITRSLREMTFFGYSQEAI